MNELSIDDHMDSRHGFDGFEGSTFNARSSRTEKDRARASADMQSSQKTVAQRLPHEEKIPQGNALRSIPFLYLYLLDVITTNPTNVERKNFEKVGKIRSVK